MTRTETANQRKRSGNPPLRCGRWMDFGSLGEHPQLTMEPCWCRTRVECLTCGERHVFVGRCTPCAMAGRPGVPWAELQESA